MGREVRWTLLAVWIPGLVLIAFTVIVSLTTELTLRELFQDTTTVAEVPFYIGSMSTLGIIGWAMTVALCLFVALATAVDDAGLRRLLIISGLFTVVLLVDDAFLLHDEILPRYAGLSGELYGIAYVVAMTVYLVTLRSVLARTNYLLLGAALVLFGLSAAADLASSRLAEMLPSPSVVILEEGSKLLGIATWLAYFVSTGRAALAERSSGSSADPVSVRADADEPGTYGQ